MCGIAGLIDFTGHEVDQNTVQRMLGTLRHRGPDATGLQAWRHVVLGHTRLSIIDPTESSNQPLSLAQRNLWITFNGEIYNFLELSRELEQAGYTFRTRSDTEVILAAYRHWGPECLHRFNGMWAFAIFDTEADEVFLARDRFGIKPLYYAEQGGRLLFASEMKSLLAAGVNSRPDFDVLRSYSGHFIADCGDQTVFSNIRALPPGHYMVVDRRSKQIGCWWNTLQQRTEVPRSWRDRVRTFHDLLEDAVRLRLRSDVETAITLSGGMDSSAIYALTQHLSKQDGLRDVTTRRVKKAHIFSVAHPGQPTDESEYVRACLEQFGGTANWLTVSPDRFRSSLTNIVWHQEAPLWSAAAFAFHEIYRKIAEAGIRVVLEGHGSDEMLGGYPYMVQAALKTFVQKHQYRRAWQAARCLCATSNPSLDQTGSSALATLLYAVRPWRPLKPIYAPILRTLQRRESRSTTSAQKPVSYGNEYLTPEFTRQGEDITAAEGEITELSGFQREMYLAFHARILPTVLRVFDRATMASSVESRMPFMDHRLVQFVFSLPESDIVGAGQTKHILRTAVRPYLPAAVVGRKEKMGFGIAAPSWFETPKVQDALSEVFGSGEFRRQECVRTKEFLRYFRDCLRNGFRWIDTTRVWEVLNIHLWWQTFVEPETSL